MRGPEILPFASRYAHGFKQLVNEIHEEFGFRFDPDLDGDLDDPAAAYNVVLLVVDRGEVVGSGALRLVGERAEIKRMYLAPPYRGRGLGREMLDSLVDSALEAGSNRVYLDTAASQQDARRLYERAGFIQTEEAPGPGESCSVVYERAIE